MTSFTIQQLTKNDWPIYKKIRLEALKNSPESFASSYEEEITWSDIDFQNSLIKSDIFGAFDNNSLVSCAGFYIMHSNKTNHRGVIWGMYTKDEFRGKGIATDLIKTIISHAKSKVIQIHLSCVSSNLTAVELYKKLGFKIYGTEPSALKIKNVYFDEYLMVLSLTTITHKI